MNLPGNVNWGENIKMKKLLTALVCGAALLSAAAEKPLVRVGLMTDTHVTPRISSCSSLKKALQIFKANNVDLIVNSGDVADTHKAQAYKNYYDTVRSVYPANKPKELFSFAWHDVINVGNWNNGWQKAWPLFKKGLGIEHEPYSKTVAGGYIFLTSPQNTDWKRYEKMIADACRETPDKPVFLIDHVPAANTTFNTGTWGNARTRRILNKYPQVVQISGHSHGSFRNELQIWQGEFTVVNVGCTSQYWGGSLVGNAPERIRTDEAMLMEIYKNKIVIRRFDLAKQIEYKKDSPWSFPLPFDPETAPYTQKKRNNVPAPQFAENSKVIALPDKVPFNSMRLTFPEAKNGGEPYIYSIKMLRKNKSGKWESFSTREIYAGFMKDPQKRKTVSTGLSSGFFDSGRSYQVEITPYNFFGKAGKPLKGAFTVPQKVETELIFESKNPMKDCPFMTGLEGGRKIAVKNGFYQHPGGNARLEFPEDVWKAPAKARFRFTVDMQMKQPGKSSWTVVLRNPKPLENANARIATPLGDSGVQRYVIEFAKRKDFHKYYLLIREAGKGEIRFDYVKIERLK